MNTAHEILEETRKKEVSSGIEELKVNSIPIWRLVRFKVRVRYLDRTIGFKNKSEKSGVRNVEILKFFFISLFQLLSLLFSKRKNVENIYFAFPRLFPVRNEFVDKFTDPIIESCDNRKKNIVFQHSFGNKHCVPRKNKDNVIYSDFIDVFAKITAKIFGVFWAKKYYREFGILEEKINIIYGTKLITKIEIAQSFLSVYIYSYLYDIIFKKLQPKNVFIVSREVFKFVSVLKSKFKFKTLELQHGITQSNTPMYTGTYIEGYDPDYFLTFGEEWVNNFYGMPLNKVKNIGFAYHSYLNNYMDQKAEVYRKKDVLVVSSPSITDSIIEFTTSFLDSKQSDICFYLRLHPQEKLSVLQRNLLKKYNITVLDNSDDAIFCISKFCNIIGDHSTVLFEALALGKKVGKLNIKNMYSRNLQSDIDNGFFIIKEFDDLDKMVNNNKYILKEQSYYSKFNYKYFDEIVNK